MTAHATSMGVDGSDWSPPSWQTKIAQQQPSYPDPNAVRPVLEALARLPPLVTSSEVDALKTRMRAAMRGELFLLQGGDCSESFEDCETSLIQSKLRVLQQMSQAISEGANTSVLHIGRIAGQYAKPRSSPVERRGDHVLPSYRGAMINRPGFTPHERAPDPTRMLAAHQHAAMTLNFIRANLATHRNDAPLMRMELFTSHEALLLPYEQALTRFDAARARWYNLSTHFPWLGNRTRRLDGAHVEYLRGIANPIAVKVGPPIEPEELLDLVTILNPANEPGRLTLIHRFGADEIQQRLPPLIDIVKRHDRAVLWCSDPMHGNTEQTPSGLKTRIFEKIVLELEHAFWIHREAGARLGGIHVELTGEDVTECIGGQSGLGGHDLTRAYRSHVDPRLNPEQALELSMRLTHIMSKAPMAPHCNVIDVA